LLAEVDYLRWLLLTLRELVTSSTSFFLMQHTMTISALALLLQGVSIVRGQNSAFTFQPCPLLGPAYPKPSNIANDRTIADALQNITASIYAALASGDLENQTTAISLTAFSTSDEQDAPFFSFHHTPPSIAAVKLGVKNVTGDAVYWIGCVSKVLTVYTLLVLKWLRKTAEFHHGIRNRAEECHVCAEYDWDRLLGRGDPAGSCIPSV
jgi:hypothetical protein